MMDIKWLHYSEQKISWKEGWKYRSKVSVGEKAKDRQPFSMREHLRRRDGNNCGLLRALCVEQPST